jgi:putative hydrolase of the HAD superfamily
MTRITTLGFDADDTLWQNEQFFRFTEARFAEMLKDFAPAEKLAQELLETEKCNLRFYGFGIKGFTLSMLETAIEVTEGKVSSEVLGKIIAAGREMLHHPVDLLPGVAETLEVLVSSHDLVLITKGDLFDQERKLAQSGLGDMFKSVEIVSDKTVETYTRIFRAMGEGPEQSMMIGNSLKSDILPALQAGAFAVHVPHDLTWEYEREEAPKDHPRFNVIATLTELPRLLASL